MIKINNLNKYFNKGKRNQIHVINNTNLNFESKGLIALLGPSGCGKTTLLNIIGGLDKVNGGQVYINDEKITGRRSGKIDQIRNLNIGYIFQNYNLIDNMTVYDNVAMVLKMIGIKDKNEIKEKVEYALDLVGMYRFRNRFADMLSGGEKQRVGIARAIVKNPAIIIADEPTGNLDKKNTLEVMNIIKSISKEKLVIIVTHENKLADFYGDRIIKLMDGQVISDEENQHGENLDYRLENRIYLKDMEHHEKLEKENYNIDVYQDGDTKVDLDIIIKKGNIYFKSKNSAVDLEVVDEDSPIEVIDAHYKEMTREESDKNQFDLGKLGRKGRIKHSSILSIFSAIALGFKTISKYNILKKILISGFLVLAMFIMYAASSIAGTLDLKDSKFVTENQNYLVISSKKNTVEKYNKYSAEKGVDYILPGDSQVSFELKHNEYLQTSGMSSYVNGSLTALDTLKKDQITSGSMPANSQEIVVDKMVVDKLINPEEGQAKEAGIGSAKELLGKEVHIDNMKPFKIVGIVDESSPSIYADKGLFTNILAGSSTSGDENEGEEEIMQEGVPSMQSQPQTDGMVDVNLKKDGIKLERGKMPTEDYEVVVNKSKSEEMPINKEIPFKVNDKKLKVVGYYSSPEETDYMLVSPNTVKYKLITESSDMRVYPSNKEAVLSTFAEQDINIKDSYENSKETYLKTNGKLRSSTLIMAGIVLIISFLNIFLIMRASFLSRLKEVGVLRAIGVNKKDIYKTFFGEIFAITMCTSVPGYLFMGYIMSKIAKISFFGDMFLVNGQVIVAGLIVIFAINTIFGLLPVFTTMRKTPAAILARGDVN